MKLEIDQIKAFIKQPQNAELLEVAVRVSNKLSMHVNGVNSQAYIAELSGVESSEELELRERIHVSNRSLFSTMLRPFDKVFSARGGSVHYDVPNENDFTNLLKIIGNGSPLRTWMRQVWKNKFITDPNGVILIEIKDERAVPTYKASARIHDYKVNGDVIEYIIFKPQKGKDIKAEGVEIVDDADYYRVIDDAFDYLVMVRGEDITIVKELTYANSWAAVPAVLCSNIPSPSSNAKISPIEEVIDIADEYLLDSSVHSVYKILHSYPIFWAYLPDCPFCKGTGRINGETGTHQCRHCMGYGKDVRKDVSKIFGLDIPQQGDANIAPPAGYVQPDVASWQQQRLELEWIQRLMHFAIWGTHTREQASNETATGRWIDSQPVNDRLDEFSEIAEMIEGRITDFIGQYEYGARYKGSSVAYGRRYMIETPDAIWKRYEAAREKGAPTATLNYLLLQYYESEFRNQPMQYERHRMLMRVEPFVHSSVDEVIAWPIDDETKAMKVYFSEWMGELTASDVVLSTEEKLRADLRKYATEQNKPNTTEL